MSAPKIDYVFRADIVEVVDGDTLGVNLQLGLHLTSVQRVRLINIDAPEKRGALHREAGKIVTELVKGWVSESYRLHGSGSFTVTTAKAGKFGRYLATIHNGSGESLNDWLVENGYAKPATDGRVEWTQEELDRIVNGS